MKNRRLWLQMKTILIVRRTPEGGLRSRNVVWIMVPRLRIGVCVCVRALRGELQKVYKVTCDLCGTEISGQVEKFAET